MKKEEEKNQPQAPETPPQEPVTPPAEPETPSGTPNEDLFMGNMGKKYPDLAGNREEIFGKAMADWDSEHEYAKKSRAQGSELNKLLESDENLNSFFVDMFTFGKEGKPWKAMAHIKPLMQSYINGEITDEEYEAEAKRLAEQDAKVAQVKEMAKKAFDAECTERGWDPAETMEKLNALINHDCETEEECREQVKNMFRILEFDDAVAAAETRGRNAKIKEQQRNHPAGVDTLPRNGGTPAGGTAPKRSLLGQAADAAAKRRAEFES